MQKRQFDGFTFSSYLGVLREQTCQLDLIKCLPLITLRYVHVLWVLWLPTGRENINGLVSNVLKAVSLDLDHIGGPPFRNIVCHKRILALESCSAMSSSKVCLAFGFREEVFTVAPMRDLMVLLIF